MTGRALPADLRDALAAYTERLSALFPGRVRFVRLFGSWARGEAREESDVDVAVVVEGLARDEWRTAVAEAVDVELACGVTLSPFVVSGEHFDLLVRRERRIAADILEEGIPA
ncbi:MAG: nucleotidyltransferase family protein [Polyangiaceae bacterium]